MIEINLIPDVKLELLRVQKTRNLVISSAIIVSIASIAVVVLISIYTYGVQGFADYSVDKTIDEQSKELSEVSDLPEMLTIQNQLQELEGKRKTSKFHHECLIF